MYWDKLSQEEKTRVELWEGWLWATMQNTEDGKIKRKAAEAYAELSGLPLQSPIVMMYWAFHGGLDIGMAIARQDEGATDDNNSDN